MDVPLAARWLQRLVRATRRAVARTADRQLHREHRQTHKHQKNQVEQHKNAAAVLPCDGREAPHVANADGTARADQNEAKAGTKALTLFLGFHSIPLFLHN